MTRPENDKPQAWMRKWYFDNEKPAKTKNEQGRWQWPPKFKFLPITVGKVFDDDVPLYMMLPKEEA